MTPFPFTQPWATAALGATIALPLLFATMPAAAQSDAVEQLRNQVEQIEARLDKLEQQQDSSAAPHACCPL